VKLVGIMFYLVENNFVKTTFAVKFPGGQITFSGGGGNPNFPPGNGLE